jgi:hypothetical protein
MLYSLLCVNGRTGSSLQMLPDQNFVHFSPRANCLPPCSSPKTSCRLCPRSFHLPCVSLLQVYLISFSGRAYNMIISTLSQTVIYPSIAAVSACIFSLFKTQVLPRTPTHALYKWMSVIEYVDTKPSRKKPLLKFT